MTYTSRNQLMLFTIILVSLLSCQPSSDQSISHTNSQADQKAIQQLIQDSFDDIFSELDTSKVSKYYTSDFILLENGELWDSKSVQAYQLDAGTVVPKPKRINKFDFIATKVTGNKGWVAYHNYATITVDGKLIAEPYWLESGTVVKKEGRWKLEMLHSTYVPPKNNTAPNKE